MLEAAFDAGIRHFDVAPMYGFGQAEGCVGEFLKRHRAEVTVTTKYGIPPTRHSGFIGMARSLARPVIKVLPRLKRRLSNVAGKALQPVERATFTPKQARLSLEQSMAALQTEHIDVWLLHEACAEDLHDEGLLRLLEDAVASGKIGTFGVGSERVRVERLITERPEYCPVVQFEWSVMDPPVLATKSFRIHHRALTENFRALHGKLIEEKAKCAAWSDLVNVDLADRDALASLMLKASLEENPQSVILFSSKNRSHIERNVKVSEDNTLGPSARRLYSLIQSEKSN